MLLPKFSRHERLLKRNEFLLISAQGRKQHTSNFIIIWRQQTGGPVRLGVTVSRRVGNAVVRNYLKRVLREFFRQNKVLFPPADYNIIAKQGAARLVFGDVCHELGRALQRLTKQQC